MEVRINVKGVAGVQAMLKTFPKQASRALEVALDQTAKKIQEDIKAEMPKVFSNPVAYTLNSLKVTKTRGHNMIAKVGFKEPPRMGQHYLVPEVEGGPRKSKGFELAAGGNQYTLADSAKKVKATGNITVGQAQAIVSGVKKRRGDYVIIKPGNKQGLLPGVYQRFVTERGFSKAIRRKLAYTAQKGRTRGRFSSAIHAKGLKPILFETLSKRLYRKKLDFYGIAKQTYEREFAMIFKANAERFTGVKW
jgi:hypothetical protein